MVAPTMTDMNGAGGYDGSDDYWKMPKGNLDPTGEYFIWTSNPGGRMDATSCGSRKPSSEPGTTPPTTEPTPPTTPPTPPPTGPTPPTTPPTTPTPPPTSPRRQRQLGCLDEPGERDRERREPAQDRRAAAACPDAGAYSQQQVSVAGFMELTMSESDTLRFIGLTSGSRRAPMPATSGMRSGCNQGGRKCARAGRIGRKLRSPRATRCAFPSQVGRCSTRRTVPCSTRVRGRGRRCRSKRRSTTSARRCRT